MKMLTSILAALLVAGSAWAAPAVEHGYMAVFYEPGTYEPGTHKPFVWHTIYYGDSEAGVAAAIKEASPTAVIMSIEDWARGNRSRLPSKP